MPMPLYDDTARKYAAHALTEEAIALVSLSHAWPQHPAAYYCAPAGSTSTTPIKRCDEPDAAHVQRDAKPAVYVSPRQLTAEDLAARQTSPAAPDAAPTPASCKKSADEHWAYAQQPPPHSGDAATKKRKIDPETAADDAAARKHMTLPSFRDLFTASPERPREMTTKATQQHQHALSPMPTSCASSPSQFAAMQQHQPTLAAKLIVPPELKCKYRTGKCHNVRALKSCGDYHNLCNHHRLRANANQRKLDRKKKVQRQQQTRVSANQGAGQETNAVMVAAAAAASAAAAVEALAALPSLTISDPAQESDARSADESVEQLSAAADSCASR